MKANWPHKIFDTVRQKVEDGQRLSAAEGEALFDPQVDLHLLGQLADSVRRRRHGQVAYYNVNAHLNPTNVCVYRCPLCAYSRDASDPRAYVMSRDEILQRGHQAAESGATELHLVGGVHPDKPFDWYRDIVASLHAAFPRLHVKAWTAVEIAWFSQIAGLSIRGVLQELIAAGLGSLPGGGAEIFHPDVRRQIAPRKADAATWLEVHRTAHELGLRSNATMLYGHLETAAHRVDHLLRLRELQDQTGGFQGFIPLAFHPAGTQLGRLVPRRPTAMEDLRVMAVSRLVLDNFDHLKAYWISLGVGTAQVALAYGADDLDGTVRHEAIHHEAGSEAPESLSIDQLCTLIRQAGRQPVERDTLYRPIRREGTRWELALP
ncbi:MAG: aminofutalosine synthase MqnE [Thermoguttaceae bacterium]